MFGGLADAEWVASWIGLAKDYKYDLRNRDLLNREFRITSIMSTEDDSQMNLAAITDAKSVCDNLVREQYSGAEKRAALEMCVIKDSLESLGGKARRVPHDVNPTDCRTKLKGNASEMLKLLRTGRYRLTEEEAELIKRKEYREATGMRTPRPKRQHEGHTAYRRRGMAYNSQSSPPSSAANSNSQNFFFHNFSDTPTFEVLPGIPEELSNGSSPDQISDVSSNVSSMSGSAKIAITAAKIVIPHCLTALQQCQFFGT